MVGKEKINCARKHSPPGEERPFESGSFFFSLAKVVAASFDHVCLVRRDASGLGPTSEKMTKNADAFESAFWWSALFATARARGRFFPQGL